MKRHWIVFFALLTVPIVAGIVVHFNIQRFDSSPTSCAQLELPDAESVRFLAFGCHGTGGMGQKAVSRAAGTQIAEAGADLVLLLGDNFYHHGVDGVDDPQWQTKFEEMYPEEDFPVPFLTVLGNHDYKSGNPKAQIEYTKKSTRWTMPAQHHCLEVSLRDGTKVGFFGIDSNVLTKWYLPNNKLLSWLRRALKGSDAKWKVVFAHHPLWSSGKYGDYPSHQRQLMPIFREHGVQFYFSAHEHDLEIVKPREGLVPVISGAGGQTRDIQPSEKSLFAMARLGFVWTEVDVKSATVKVLSEDKKQLFETRFAWEDLEKTKS